MAKAAAAGHRVVLIDHRGCGESSKDFADMGIEAIAGDVVALVEHLGLSKVVLNGWSLGGSVVVAAATVPARPVWEKVRCTAVLESPPSVYS